MSNSSSDNISLIYEFNPDSPLFARVALEEMEQGKYSEALKILEDGISRYPNYPTANFIYAQTLAHLGEYEKAIEAVEKGAAILDSNEAREFYLSKVEEIKNKNSIVEESKRVSFLEDDGDSSADDEEIANKEEQEVPLEDRLDELAKELEHAKIPPPNKEDLQPLSTKEYQEEIEGKDYISFNEVGEIFDEEDLASETMAMILEGQGKLIEAKRVYQKLIEKEPEKSAIFELKINEIDQKLSSSE